MNGHATDRSYDSTSIALHWATAIFVLALWGIGQTADWIPDGSANTGYWSVHVLLGFGLAAVITCRVVWRAFRGRRLPPADTGALKVVARMTHYSLYGLLVVAVTLGIVNAFVRGYDLFGIAHLPQVGDSAWRKPITQWHGLAANVLLGLASFHAAAALIHQYIWHDGLLGRMVPRFKKQAGGDPACGSGTTPTSNRH